MIKVAVEGCLVLMKGGGERGEGHIGVCIRGIYFTMLGDMESNDRRNVLAHNESLKLLSTISLSTINSNLSFLNYCFVKTLFQDLL